MNLYQVLGVCPDASKDQIKRAYRKIARENHPDKFPDDDEKMARFKVAATAYEVLSDPARRAVYDRESRAAASIQELLTKMVGGRMLSAMLPHAPAARRDGQDLIVCLPQKDDHVEISDPREPGTVHRVAMPLAHMLARVADRGTPGTSGGSSGALFIIAENNNKEE